MDNPQLAKLTARIYSLEEKMLGLRLSRRLLLDLLASREAEKREQLVGLERENRRLHRENAVYARTLLERNGELMLLRETLRGGETRETGHPAL